MGFTSGRLGTLAVARSFFRQAQGGRFVSQDDDVERVAYYSLPMTDELSARRHDRLADPFAGAVAGIPAGLAYLLAEGIDNTLSRRRLFDLQLLGRPFVRSTRAANVVGSVIHLGNSVALGSLYGAVAERHLPGPPAIKGMIFVTIENTVLYPVLALERFHPARKAGDMGSYWSFRSWLWTMPRHFAYGVVLAMLFDRLRNE